jgi:UDP-N-acetylglucosamine--N-acetylmuramyl-(pentapeptide) pyrophosphoryl-undecaprenol N-acetylglucosamine transferase
MSNTKEVIIFVGGGTKGHLFPAVAIGDILQNEYKKTSIIITDIPDAQSTTLLKVVTIPRMTTKVSLVSKVILLWNMVHTLFKLLYMYAKYRPKVIVGFGGFTTFIPLLAAVILRIPIIIHEQNSVLGKVNEIMARYAYKISLGFFDALTLPEKYVRKCVFNKNPVRKEIKLHAKPTEIPMQKYSILIIGGSQGAKAFNTIIPRAIKHLRTTDAKTNLKISQQASKDQHQYLQDFYQKLSIECQTEEFFLDMTTKYNESDLVICRSGASTIEELVALNKPSILIPLPTSAKNHQSINAQYLENLGCAWRIEQDDNCVQMLSALLFRILHNPAMLTDMSYKLSHLKNKNRNNLEDEIIKAL